MKFQMTLLLCMVGPLVGGFLASAVEDVASAVYAAGVGIMLAVMYHAEVTGPRGEL